jgi:ABC-2 type transport system permease protein
MIATWPLVGVTLRGVLGRRRTVLLILLAGLPVAVGLLIRLTGASPEAAPILDTLIVRTVMPLIALVFGTAALGSEIEDGTAVYLMIKPIPRWRILLAKMGVAALLTAALVLPSTLLTGIFAGGLDSTALATTFGFAVAASIGGIAYACAFVALSAFTSRALLLGLGYTLIWEGVLSGLLEGTRFLSIRQATLGIAAALGHVDPGLPPLDLGTSLVILAVVVVGSFMLGSARLARFEIRGGD